jgi:hypothetical protein
MLDVEHVPATMVELGLDEAGRCPVVLEVREAGDTLLNLVLVVSRGDVESRKRRTIGYSNANLDAF